MNYDKEMLKIIESLEGKGKLLLHSCCGPCSTSVIEKLKDYFDITVFYYNPNIEPKEEYEKRKKEQMKVLERHNLKYLDVDYENKEFKEIAKGLETEKEGGKRCHKCFLLRLKKTAEKAKENNFAYFTTTLTVSPYKNSEVINKIGLFLEKEYGVKYLVSDFKKRDGYKRSIELSKEYGLYRQHYCGCFYSLEYTKKEEDYNG